jgi:hypothetical protein
LMCSTLMFGTLKLGLIDLQSAPPPTSTFQTSTCYTSTALYFNREWLKFRAQWLYQKLCRSTALYINEN